MTAPGPWAIPLALVALVASGPASSGSPPQTSAGFAQPVSDPATVARIARRFEQELRAMAIPASVQSCRLMAQVAVGSRGGDTAFGAACKVGIGAAAPVELLICDDDFGDAFALQRRGFVDTPAWMADFVRTTCF